MVKGYRVVYGSSENAELSLIDEKAHDFRHNSLCLDRQRIKYR
jgi:hypothetical protein